MKTMFNTIHDWISRQNTFVQISISFTAAFVVIALLGAAFG